MLQRALWACCSPIYQRISAGLSAKFLENSLCRPNFKKKSKSGVRNCRLISLLPILSKVMETVINRADTNFLEKNSILSYNQYSFRQGMNTQDILTLLSHHWHTTSARDGSTRVIAVDVAGAFGKVSHWPRVQSFPLWAFCYSPCMAPGLPAWQKAPDHHQWYNNSRVGEEDSTGCIEICPGYKNG